MNWQDQAGRQSLAHSSSTELIHHFKDFNHCLFQPWAQLCPSNTCKQAKGHDWRNSFWAMPKGACFFQFPLLSDFIQTIDFPSWRKFLLVPVLNSNFVRKYWLNSRMQKMYFIQTANTITVSCQYQGVWSNVYQSRCDCTQFNLGQIRQHNRLINS